MNLIFPVLVVAGFALHLAGSLGARHCTSAAWGVWLAASLLWAIG